MFHHFLQSLKASPRIADQGQINEPLSVSFEHQIVGEFAGFDSLFLRNGRETLLRAGLIVGRVAEGIHHAESPNDHHRGPGQLSFKNRLAREELSLHGRVAQSFETLLGIHLRIRLESRRKHEGMKAALPAEQEPRWPLCHLRGETTSLGMVLIHGREQSLVLQGVHWALQAGKGHGPSRLLT